MIEIKHSCKLAAAETALGAALFDPEILKQAIPGCAVVRRVNDKMFWGVVSVGILRMTFDLDATINVEPTSDGYAIGGKVRAGSTPLGAIDMMMSLSPQKDGTQIDSVSTIRPLRRHGKIVTSAAKAVAARLLRTFFERLDRALSVPAR